MKINTLTLNNFRAFPGPEDQIFALDGKNLLIYGENGSGKSSVFHALKTFFTLNASRSVIDTRNVFSGFPDHWIEVEFDDGQPAARWDGPPHIPNRVSDARVTEAASLRGCFDYRDLLDTNYGHGDNAMNWFEIAVGPLLGDHAVPALGSVLTKTIAELWEACHSPLWKDAARTETIGRRSSRVMEGVLTAVAEFNMGFRYALKDIKPTIDELLKALPVEGMTLADWNFDAVTYNYDAKDFDGKVLTPVIKLHAYSPIRPQNFLNEARLSALGIAIYLAGRLTIAPTGGDKLKLLVMDDVLIGIDLSNRLPLLDLLRERFSDWQIVLLTHDRVWFEMARIHTQGSGKWKCLEIYDRMCVERNIPCPVIRKANDKAAQGCLEDAKRFLNDPTGPHEAAAANYARSGFELTLKKCCENFGIPVRYKMDARTISSQDFLNAIEIWLNDKQKPFLDAALERVKMFRSVVLNQGSHSAPPNIARSEIEGAILAVESLLQLTESKSDADAQANCLDKADELAQSQNNADWIASLGYTRGALAIKLREFCKNKRIKIKFGDRSVATLWAVVYADHQNMFKGNIVNTPAEIEQERSWLIEQIDDTKIQALTQPDILRLISILKKWE